MTALRNFVKIEEYLKCGKVFFAVYQGLPKTNLTCFIFVCHKLQKLVVSKEMCGSFVVTMSC